MTKEEKKIYNKIYYKANKEQRKARYKSSITHYVAYKHTNDKGDVYIGSGSNLRPYEKGGNGRGKNWKEAFSDGCTTTILKRFNTLKDARVYEQFFINRIGLDNLVNQKNLIL